MNASKKKLKLKETRSKRQTAIFYKDFAANGGELYLTEIRRFAVGLYDLMVDNIIQTIAFDEQDHLLDLGSGVANIEERILDMFPNINITCVDNTPEMIQAGQERLTYLTKKPHFICQDILTLKPEGKFKTIISNLTIHNLSIDEKKCLLKKIKSWLTPNGIFIWGDFMEFENKKHGDEIMQKRKQRILESNGVDPHFVEEILTKESQDARLTVEQTKQLLTEIDFQNIEVIWHQDFLAILKATL